MHEWALAEGVVSTAIEVAKDNNSEKIVEINIKIGSLQQIDMEVFKFALDEIAKESIAEDSQKKIETEDAMLECRNCGERWEFEKLKKI